jgi:uncharacterized protein (DUF3084 family)
MSDELEYINREIRDLKADVKVIEQQQHDHASEFHKIDKDVVQVQTDVKYIRQSQDSLNLNLNRIMLILVGSIITAVITFIVKGGFAL